MFAAKPNFRGPEPPDRLGTCPKSGARLRRVSFPEMCAFSPRIWKIKPAPRTGSGHQTKNSSRWPAGPIEPFVCEVPPVDNSPTSKSCKALEDYSQGGRRRRRRKTQHILNKYSPPRKSLNAPSIIQNYSSITPGSIFIFVIFARWPPKPAKQCLISAKN